MPIRTEPAPRYIVLIEGPLFGEPSRHTYELEDLELTITYPQDPFAGRRSPAEQMAAGVHFTLSGAIVKSESELMQPTIAEVNAALADAYRLRQAVREVAEMLSAETWGSAKAKLEAALR